ncbi:MAG TPA: MBL fold metallo-hydrolase [Candidatus Hydrogenedentes bacterium]|nr:MBL fold metallo-hydrolase [Candidatus Hydrogenedentota bacterium]
MLRFSLLGSGSGGNAVLVMSPRAKILIDCGLSHRQLRLRTEAVGASLDGLDGVFITHEHGDHVGGLRVLTRQSGVPVYLTAGTHGRLPAPLLGIPNAVHIEAGDTVSVGDLEVASYSVSHDAADPVNYVVRWNGAQLGLATDLGHVSHVVRRSLAGSHAVVLESNYCPRRLLAGDYPPQVRQRIRSRIGHLSNQDMCSLLADLIHDQLSTVVLVHLSENNNAPEIVRELAENVLRGHPARLYLAEQDRPTPFFEVNP